jgi:ATP-dependent DNA ligase
MVFTTDGGGDGAASGRSTSPTRLKAGRIAAAITLGTPISPMLASSSKWAADVVAKCPNGCYTETKYDGERIQIHKQGATFSFFSRANQPMKPDTYGDLEKEIAKAIRVRVTDVVLDGEIVLVDTRTSKPLPVFDTLGKKQPDTAIPAIFLFDILYLDGESLLNRPLDWRRDKLRQCVEPISNRILFSDVQVITGPKDQQEKAIEKLFTTAVGKGFEGLVVKDMKSTYEPGSRRWIKLTKETADLIVLGAWYGTGARGGKLSTFLMGVLDTSLPQSAPRRFKTVTSVADGLDDDQLAKLQPVFLSTMVPTGGVAPAWLDVHSSNMPDMVPKDPYSAPVWEIMCNEYTVSKVHTARTISMRFGRIVRIRDDKDPMTATSLDELVKLVVQASKEPAQQGPVNDPAKGAESTSTSHDGGVAHQSPPDKPEAPTKPKFLRRAHSPDVSDLVAYIATATQRLKDFASGHHHVDLPDHMHSWRVFVTGYAPDLADALRAAVDALGFKRAPSGERADVVIADTLSEVRRTRADASLGSLQADPDGVGAAGGGCGAPPPRDAEAGRLCTQRSCDAWLAHTSAIPWRGDYSSTCDCD